MRVVFSLLLFSFVSLALYFTSSYAFFNAESDYYLVNHYEFFYDLTKEIELIFGFNIINSIFVAKIVLLLPIIIAFAIIFKKTTSLDYYALSITFYISIFLMIFFIANQTQETKTNNFYSDKLKQEVFIPSLAPIEFNIKIYHILPLVSFLLFLIIRRYISSPFLVLILLPSILIALYHIYIYKNDYLPIIDTSKIDINNSLIISLKNDEQKLKYNFKNNIFISDDYILSDILSHYNNQILNKSFFYLKYFDKNNTMKNVLVSGKKNNLKKDIYIYTNKINLYNIYSIFQLTSYDILKNKNNDTLMDMSFIRQKLDSNSLYHKSITKKIYQTNKAIFHLSKGMLIIDNKEMYINNAFLVNKEIQKIKYNNNSPSKIVSIVIDDKYLVLCHEEYVNSFFIQTLIFRNYAHSLVSSVYNQDGINIIKITNPTKENFLRYRNRIVLVLREEYRSIFLFLLATLTGTFTSFYQVLTAEAELYVLIVSVLGFTSSIFIMILIKKLRLKMDSDI